MSTEDEKAADAALQQVEDALDQLRELQGNSNLYLTPRNQSEAEPPLCSFCGRGTNQVRRMLQGNEAYICDGCITLAGEISKAP